MAVAHFPARAANGCAKKTLQVHMSVQPPHCSARLLSHVQSSSKDGDLKVPEGLEVIRLIRRGLMQISTESGEHSARHATCTPHKYM